MSFCVWKSYVTHMNNSCIALHTMIMTYTRAQTWNCSFVCVTGLIHVCHMFFSHAEWLKWLVRMCRMTEMTHSHLWHDMAHSYVWPHYDIVHSYVWPQMTHTMTQLKNPVYGWVISRVRFILRTKESCHTDEVVTQVNWMSNVTYVSHSTHKRVTSHI